MSMLNTSSNVIRVGNCYNAVRPSDDGAKISWTKGFPMELMHDMFVASRQMVRKTIQRIKAAAWQRKRLANVQKFIQMIFRDDRLDTL